MGSWMSLIIGLIRPKQPELSALELEKTLISDFTLKHLLI